MKNEKYELDWTQYDWREFEVICFEYIKTIFSAKFYKRKLTRAQKDRGRDIIIKGRKNKFEAWGECKAHKRNVDLSIIGKNIVLALSHQIDKAIFFSVSPITLNTKIEILNIAQRFGFEVLFLDGNELNKTILSCNKIAYKYFPKEYEQYYKDNSNKICVNTFLSEYPYAEDAKGNTKLQYHLKNGFQIFLHIFIKNVHCEDISNISISLINAQNSEIIFYKSNYITKDVLTSYADLLYTFSGLVFSPNPNIALPKVKINCKYLDGTHEEVIAETGEIDASDVWKAPYVNSDNADFLYCVNIFLKKVVPEKYVRIIYIYGNSGMGKSRLMTEIENKAYEFSYRVIHIDFRRKDEIECIKDLIKALLGLPSSKRKLSVNFEEFCKIFVNQSLEVANISIIYKFLYECDNKVSYSELTSAIINILVSTSERDCILIGIDNIQELSVELQLLFWKLLEYCREISISVCFLLAQNTERFPQNHNSLIEYLKITGENCENYILPQQCSVLGNVDAIALIQQLLHLVPDSTSCLEQLFNLIETCPMDILLLSKSLAQTTGLFRRIGTYRYIMDPQFFLKKAVAISKSTDELVKNRLSNLRGTFEIINTYNYIFSLINFFEDILPMEVFEACSLKSDLLIETNQNLITKINCPENTISFYHEKIFTYFQKNAIALPMSMLDTIYNFCTRESNQNVVSAYMFVKLLVARKNYETAILNGLKVIDTYQQTNQSQNVCKTCDLLQQIINPKTHPKEYFYVIFAKADILLERVNISEAETLFDHAKEIMDEKNKLFSQQDVIHFFHRYINQKLHTLQYDKGLVALKEFEKLDISNVKANMIINDRYCVAYYSLGMKDKAIKRINDVIQTAQNEKNNVWLSIAYSDKAFIYFYNSKNITKICENFKLAIKYHKLSGKTNDVSRKIELLIQEAICCILENKYDLALKCIQKSVQVAEKIIYGYLLVPAFNIHAYILFKKMEVKNAHALLKKALSYANSFSNRKAFVSVYNNLGNMYIIKGNYKQAMDYYQAAYEILKDICIPSNSFRYLGLLCNIIKISIILNDNKRARDVINDYNMFDELTNYYEKCKQNIGQILDLFSFSYGVLELTGFDYLY